MKDEYEQNGELDLNENLVLIKVEEDETLHSHDLYMIDLNGEGDRDDGVESLCRL